MPPPPTKPPMLHLQRCLLVENVPRHHCTHPCAHCGYDAPPTSRRSIGYDLAVAVRRIDDALARANEHEGVDHIAIAADGEPTLDRQLGELLAALGRFGLPRVVYSNGGTFHRDDVRQELAEADVVCLALDTVDPAAWPRMHHRSPHAYELVLQGVRVFPSTYRGEVVTQTTLRADVNTDRAQIEETADFLSALKPTSCYLRQHPDETPSAARVERALRIFSERNRRAVLGDPYAAVSATVRLTGGVRAARPAALAASASAN